MQQINDSNKQNKTEYVFKLYGVVLNKLHLFFKNLNVNYSVYVNKNDVLLKLNFNGVSSDVTLKIIREFLEEFSKFVYAEADVSLGEQLVKILSIRGAKISCAESFTGGNLSAQITSISGASAVFYEGLVTYNSNAKINRLNVNQVDVQNYGVVSSKVAYQMCSSLIKTGNCNLALSTTGLAGPNSDESGLPVGLCYIGVATEEHTVVYKYNFKGTRQEITNQGVETALFLAIKALRNGIYNV